MSKVTLSIALVGRLFWQLGGAFTRPLPVVKRSKQKSMFEMSAGTKNKWLFVEVRLYS